MPHSSEKIWLVDPTDDLDLFAAFVKPTIYLHAWPEDNLQGAEKYFGIKPRKVKVTVTVEEITE